VLLAQLFNNYDKLDLTILTKHKEVDIFVQQENYVINKDLVCLKIDH